MGLARKFFTISSLTIVSRVFGIVREAVLIRFLGASIEMDAFTTAFKFPSFFRRFFAESGFQSIFVPYFTDFVVAEKLKGATYFSSRIFSLIFLVMLIATVIVCIFAEQFTILMAPGFINSPEKLALTIEFTRIIFPSIAFISLSSVYCGILVSYQKFFIFAMIPILVNCLLVLSLFICQDMISTGRRISYGTLAAGIFQFVYMYICIKVKKLPSPKLLSLKMTPKIKELLKKLIPVLAGAGVAQINVLTGSFFASYLPTGCITFLHCADRFIQFPLALFGVSIGIVLLPEISEQIAKKKYSNLKDVQTRALLFTLRLTLPSVVALISLSYCAISLIYGYGKFDQDAIQNTSNILKASSLGLPAYVVAKVMSSILFAQKDSKTPLIAAIFSIVANIVFVVLLIIPFKEIGIAVGASLAGFVNVFIMFKKSKGSIAFEKSTIIDSAKILLASLIMFAVILFINSYYNLRNLKVFEELLLIGMSCIIGAIVYIGSLFILGDSVMRSFFNFIRKKVS
ncbi:MAG: murein biosynthesis integral membrane protein MurJ [Holosporales bacterium]|jgi:putative peptidoglycan lipid II flippase|nr:murein biosynthesis integral membrane protein MurJ [Holosporales bacterium]